MVTKWDALKYYAFKGSLLVNSPFSVIMPEMGQEQTPSLIQSVSDPRPSNPQPVESGVRSQS